MELLPSSEKHSVPVPDSALDSISGFAGRNLAGYMVFSIEDAVNGLDRLTIIVRMVGCVGII